MPRPAIFISAVSKELKSSRQLVANTLQFLGYEPIWQDIFGTEEGDLRSMLREKIDGCEGVIQLVGKCYGAEPPALDQQFGRVSYTQYEALYARQRGKKVWYLFPGDAFPSDATRAESEELRELQATYRRRLEGDSHLYHPFNSHEALEASVLKLRDDLARLRRGVKQWAWTVLALLAVIAVAVVWLEWGQKQQSHQLTDQDLHLAALQGEMAKLLQGVEKFPQVQSRIRQEDPRETAAEVRQRTYQQLGKQLGLDARTLEEKLPEFARQLRRATNATTYERATAAFVNQDYSEAERLALLAATEATNNTPPNTKNAIDALELAGGSAETRAQFSDALHHFRDAARLIDRSRQPLEWAEDQSYIGMVLEELGQYADAGQVWEEALKESRHLLGEEDEKVIAIRLAVAVTLADQGSYAEAETQYYELLKLEDKVLEPLHLTTLATRVDLANVLLLRGKYAEAETIDNSVIQLGDKAPPEYAVGSLYNLAMLREQQGRFAEAETNLRRVITTEKGLLDPDNPKTLTVWAGLAGVLEEQGRFSEAEEECRKVLELREKVLGQNHPDTFASRDILALILEGEGKYSEAEAILKEVIKWDQETLGPEHPRTILNRHNLAVALSDDEKLPEAEAEIRQVLRIREKVLGPDHPDTLSTRANLALALQKQGKYPEAEAVDRAVILSEERVLGAENPKTLAIRGNLAIVLEDEDKTDEAETLDREVLKLQERILGPEHPDTLLTRLNLANCLEKQGKYDDAESAYRQVIPMAEKVFGPQHPSTLLSRLNLAAALEDQGKYAEAETEDRSVIKLEQETLGPKHPRTLHARANLANVLQDEGKNKEAVDEFRDVIKLENEVLGPQHRATLATRVDFADVLKKEGDASEAEAEYRNVLKLQETVFGTNDPDTVQTRVRLTFLKLPEVVSQTIEDIKQATNNGGTGIVPVHPSSTESNSQSTGLSRKQ
ncbi:MAG: tetratricopeptide repeat protein [Limisphaerales bacterium]